MGNVPSAPARGRKGKKNSSGMQQEQDDSQVEARDVLPNQREASGFAAAETLTSARI